MPKTSPPGWVHGVSRKYPYHPMPVYITNLTLIGFTLMQLVIGNKNYSTWSLRPWLLLTAYGVEFEEVQESLLLDGLTERLGQYSPTSRVPVLLDGDLCVWDSLAICEYVSEAYLNGAGWPGDVHVRAQARALTAEMHSGFSALRAEMPMNIRARRRITPSEQALADVRRINDIWSGYTAESRWLFGDFGIVDSFYAPVALRFETYEVELSMAARAYQQHLLSHFATRQWIDAALQETEVVAEDEAGEPV